MKFKRLFKSESHSGFRGDGCMRKPDAWKTILTSLSVASLLATAAAAQPSSFLQIDYPEATTTQAWGISPRGDIIGFYTSAGQTHGFLLSDGHYSPIDFPGATSTSATAINPRGDIVGSYVVEGVFHGFLLSHGRFTSIDIPGAASTEVLGISANGDMVGDYHVTSKTPCCFTGTHGFLLNSPGNYVQIDFPGPGVILTYVNGINPDGSVVGSYSDSKAHGFLLSGANAISLEYPNPTTTFMNALGINPRGDIVGRYVDANAPGRHGYLLSDGQYTSIDIPGASFTGATAIDPQGDIVGRFIGADGKFHGFLMRKGEFK
jgi:uncharacterized membrane protein